MNVSLVSGDVDEVVLVLRVRCTNFSSATEELRRLNASFSELEMRAGSGLSLFFGAVGSVEKENFFQGKVKRGMAALKDNSSRGRFVGSRSDRCCAAKRATAEGDRGVNQ